MMNPNPPDIKTLYRMLSSTLGLWGIVIYLCISYLSDPKSYGFFLLLSIPSLLLAVFIVVAVGFNKQCQMLFKFAEWLDEKFVTIWIFTSTLVIASNRLIQIIIKLLNKEIVESNAIIATLIIILSFVFITALYIVMFKLPLSLDKNEAAYKRLEFLLSGAFCLLFSACLFPTLSILSISITSQDYAPYSNFILLTVTVILMLFAVNIISNPKLPLTLAIIISVISISLLGITYAFPIYPSLSIVYLVSMIIALIILTIAMFKVDRENLIT